MADRIRPSFFLQRPQIFVFYFFFMYDEPRETIPRDKSSSSVGILFYPDYIHIFLSFTKTAWIHMSACLSCCGVNGTIQFIFPLLKEKKKNSKK